MTGPIRTGSAGKVSLFFQIENKNELRERLLTHSIRATRKWLIDTHGVKLSTSTLDLWRRNVLDRKPGYVDVEDKEKETERSKTLIFYAKLMDTINELEREIKNEEDFDKKMRLRKFHIDNVERMMKLCAKIEREHGSMEKIGQDKNKKKEEKPDEITADDFSEEEMEALLADDPGKEPEKGKMEDIPSSKSEPVLDEDPEDEPKKLAMGEIPEVAWKNEDENRGSTNPTDTATCENCGRTRLLRMRPLCWCEKDPEKYGDQSIPSEYMQEKQMRDHKEDFPQKNFEEKLSEPEEIVPKPIEEDEIEPKPKKKRLQRMAKKHFPAVGLKPGEGDCRCFRRKNVIEYTNPFCPLHGDKVNDGK